MRKSTVFLIVCTAFLSSCALKVVDVGAPDVNCVFDPSCTIQVTDSSDTIPLPTGGTNFLQSRTFKGETGSAASGLFGYEYRIDLRNALGITYIPCISSLKIEFGLDISELDYDGDGTEEHVFVVTRGGLGSVGVASAEKNDNEITFTFTSPVCAGGRPGDGQSTFFFGLASPQKARYLTAKVKEVIGPEYDVQVQAPEPGGS